MQPERVGGRHLVTADSATAGPATAVPDQIGPSGDDGDRFGCAIPDNGVQGASGQVLQADRALADQPHARHELRRARLTAQDEARYQLRDRVLGTRHGRSVCQRGDHVGC